MPKPCVDFVVRDAVVDKITERGHGAKECRRLPEAGKCEGKDSPPEPPERMRPCGFILDF